MQELEGERMNLKGDDSDSEGGNNEGSENDEDQDDYSTKNKKKYIKINLIHNQVSDINTLNYQIKASQIPNYTATSIELFKLFREKRSIYQEFVSCCVPKAIKGTISYLNDAKLSIARMTIKIIWKFQILDNDPSISMLRKYLMRKCAKERVKEMNIPYSQTTYQQQFNDALQSIEYNYGLINNPNNDINANQFNVNQEEDSFSMYNKYIELLKSITDNKLEYNEMHGEIKHTEIISNYVLTKQSGDLKINIKPKFPFKNGRLILKDWEILISYNGITNLQFNLYINCLSPAQSYNKAYYKVRRDYKFFKAQYYRFHNKAIKNTMTAFDELQKFEEYKSKLLDNPTNTYTTYTKYLNKKSASRFKRRRIRYLKKPTRIGKDKWIVAKTRMLRKGAMKGYFTTQKSYLKGDQDININRPITIIYSPPLYDKMFKISEYNIPFLKKDTIEFNGFNRSPANIERFNLYSLYFEVILVPGYEDNNVLMNVNKNIIENDSFVMKVYLISKGKILKLDNEQENNYKKRLEKSRNESNEEYQSRIDNLKTSGSEINYLGSSFFNIRTLQRSLQQMNDKKVAKINLRGSIKVKFKSCVVKDNDLIYVIIENSNKDISYQWSVNSYIKYKYFNDYYSQDTQDTLFLMGENSTNI